jgi:hypothetical protein
MRAYIKLAVAALQAGELLWPSRPKWHVTWYYILRWVPICDFVGHHWPHELKQLDHFAFYLIF